MRIPHLALILFVVGCGDPLGVPRADDTLGEREGRVILVGAPFDGLTSTEGRLVSEPLGAWRGVDRVSVLSGGLSGIEVISGEDGWVELESLSAGVHRHALDEPAAEVAFAIPEASAGWMHASASSDREPRFEERPEIDSVPLAQPFRALAVVERGSWGAARARCVDREHDGEKDRISIHDTLTPSGLASAELVAALQQHETAGLGFCDVGYHFLVGADGSIYEGRSLELESGHAGDADPAGNIAIAFLGCFDSVDCGSLGGEAPTDAALEAAGELLRTIGEVHGIPIDGDRVRTFAGCDRPSPECAGDRLVEALPDLLARAGGGSVDVDGGVPPDAGPVVPDPPPPMSCGDAGCEWCASKGACLVSGEACAWSGDVGGERCWSELDPCGVASCWDPTLTIPACTSNVTPEDFSSGRYNLHRYAASLPGGAPVTLRLTRTSGVLEPALIVTDAFGQPIYAGDAASLLAGVVVSDAVSGRGGDVATVTLESATDLSIRVHVTGWSVVDAGFALSLPTNVSYSLETDQACMSMPGTSRSESVGSPSSGSLRDGVRITPHPGYVIADTGRDAYWGTQETVDLIRSGFDEVVRRHPSAQVVQVRDMSILGGGAPSSGPWPHASHESGRDLDATYHLDSCSSTSGCPIADAPLETFDAEAVWTLFEHWLSRDAVTYIFVDHALQRLLYEEAMRRGATSAQLERWIQYPRASDDRQGIVRHITNHRNHFHVRFRCPGDDAACVE